MVDHPVPRPIEPVLPEFRAVFDASSAPLLLAAADPPNYTMLAVNLAHARAFNTTSKDLEGWGVLEVFPKDAPPDVEEFAAAIKSSFDAVFATGVANEMPIRRYAIVLPDGRTDERFWSATNSPIVAPDGRVTHIVSAVRDVTGEVGERRSEEARQLLMREVDHRARNALTIVQTFIRLTTAETVNAFRAILEGRVDALARAQTSLAARRWEGGDLREVVTAELAPIAAIDQFNLAGPPVLLIADHVQVMSMFVHELATNAGKYGGLSMASGVLDVTWTRSVSGDLVLNWRESGGPAVSPPTRTGFGSRLIRQLARQLNGVVAYDWAPGGLQVTLSFHLRRD